MQKTRIALKARIMRMLKTLAGFIKRRYKTILYYGAVILVLALVANAAESYRTDNAGGQALVLPENVLAEAAAQAGNTAIYPENMHLLRAFSDQPQWNGELGQWEIHAANDYAFDDGRAVCLSGGIVQDVGESGVKGGYIEIESDGKVYIYSSIAPDKDILPGMQVGAGDAIGLADESMPSEMLLGRHVHLEVYENGAPLDFEKLEGKNSRAVD